MTFEDRLRHALRSSVVRARTARFAEWLARGVPVPPGPPRVAAYGDLGGPESAVLPRLRAGRGGTDEGYHEMQLKQPMRNDPPGFRIMAARWFRPDEHDEIKAPVYVMFTIVAYQRRAVALARDRAGMLYAQEYVEAAADDGAEQLPFAQRIHDTYRTQGAGDPLINCIGDPLDAWIVGGELPQ